LRRPRADSQSPVELAQSNYVDSQSPVEKAQSNYVDSQSPVEEAQSSYTDSQSPVEEVQDSCTHGFHVYGCSAAAAQPTRDLTEIINFHRKTIKKDRWPGMH
jgi:hypothetical protein